MTMSGSRTVPFLEPLLKAITPASMWYAQVPLTPEQMQQAIKDSVEHGVTLDCIHLHPNHCFVEKLQAGVQIFGNGYKVYVLVHVIPHLLFKKDRFSKQALKKLSVNIGLSFLFLMTYAVVFEYFWCYIKRLNGSMTSTNTKFFAMICASSVLLDRPSRWGELSMNVFPRYLESLPIYFGKQHLWPRIPKGTNIMFALAMGCIASVHFTDQEAVKRHFRFLLKLILGEPSLEMDRKTRETGQAGEAGEKSSSAN